MERISSHSVEEIFKAFDKGKSKFAGASLKSTRIVNFRFHGVDCVACGLTGTNFIVEKHKKDVSPHLNLYHISPTRFVLMTRDHIRPVSKGGADCIHNLQPMCSKCNSRKAGSWGRRYKTLHLISFLKHKLKGQCKCSFKKVLSR